MNFELLRRKRIVNFDSEITLEGSSCLIRIWCILPLSRYHEADMRNGKATYWQLTSLQAFWPGLQVSFWRQFTCFWNGDEFLDLCIWILALGSCWGYSCCQFITSWIRSCLEEVWSTTRKVWCFTSAKLAFFL